MYLSYVLGKARNPTFRMSDSCFFVLRVFFSALRAHVRSLRHARLALSLKPGIRSLTGPLGRGEEEADTNLRNTLFHDIAFVNRDALRRSRAIVVVIVYEVFFQRCIELCLCEIQPRPSTTFIDMPCNNYTHSSTERLLA